MKITLKKKKTKKKKKNVESGKDQLSLFSTVILISVVFVLLPEACRVYSDLYLIPQINFHWPVIYIQSYRSHQSFSKHNLMEDFLNMIITNKANRPTHTTITTTTTINCGTVIRTIGGEGG